MARKILALDIKEDAIAAVSVKIGFRVNSIEAHILVPIPDSDDGMVQALERVSNALDVDGAVCIASIPAGDVSFRNMTLPFNHAKKIRQVLPYELEQNLPISAEDLAIDFHRISSDESVNGTDIIAASMGYDRLNHYLDSLIPFGIRPERVTVGGYPTTVWLSRNSLLWENGLVLDLGNRTCTLFIVVSGEIRFIRPFPLWVTPSSDMTAFCADVVRTVSAYEEMFNTEVQPEGVLITGAESNPVGLAEAMSQQLKIPVQPVDMTQASKIGIQKDSRESWNPLRMNNALSMALTEIEGINGFNFLRQSFSEKKVWNKHGKRIVISGILACVLVVLAMFNLFYETYALQKEAAVLDQEMIQIFRRTFPDVKRIVDPLHQMRIKIKQARQDALYSGEGSGSMRVIDLLNNISGQISPSMDVDLTRIVSGPEGISISGDTDTFNTVNDIRTRLQQVQAFRSVDINSANIEKSGNRVRFKLKIEL